MLVDSGATHHMVNLGKWLAHARDALTKVSWSGSSYSHALAIGFLVGLTYAFLGKNTIAQQILFTSGQGDTLLVPDAARDLCATNRFAAQGHTVYLQEGHA